jgi:hypothetical protein
MSAAYLTKKNDCMALSHLFRLLGTEQDFRLNPSEEPTQLPNLPLTQEASAFPTK